MRFEWDLQPLSLAARAGVRHYTVLDADVAARPIERAAPVRPQPFLQLVLEGMHRLHNVETGRAVHLRRATLIGLCTHRKYNLVISGRLRVFYVHFQPGALHAWTGRDVSTLTDGCLDAREAFGPGIDLLADALAAAAPSDQPAIADTFFARLPPPPPSAVARFARAIRDGGPLDTDPSPPDGLCARQLQRRFAREIGVTPKLYARLCRLATVIDRHERDPALSWTELAHGGGYADQAHLTREFRAFVRAAPSRFRAIGAAA